jgi:hypothetical protein
MVKPFIYEVRFLSGTENDYLLERVTPAGDRKALPYEPDDENWQALLSRQSSFRFLGKCGSLSLCLERSRSKDPTRRGDKPYWSAYRKARGVQVKTYLGQDLALDKLEAAAARLQARLKEKLGLSEQEFLPTTRFASEKRREQEHKRHLLDQLQKQDQIIAQLKQDVAAKESMITELEHKLVSREEVSRKLPQSHGTPGKRKKPPSKRS